MTLRNVIGVVLCLVPMVASAQQWSGSTDTSNVIWRSGSVALGRTTADTPLHIEGSLTNAAARFGSLEIQGYLKNNTWFGDNIYFNDGFRLREPGAATLLYFFNGSFGIRGLAANPENLAGALVQPTQFFIVMPDGEIGIGGGQLYGGTGGANLLMKPSGNVTLQGASGGTVTGGVGSYRLTVVGDVKLHGPAGTGVTNANGEAYRLTIDGDVKVGGFISASYEDLAEWVPAREDLPAGTVVVLDPLVSNVVTASTQPYDTSVAGVISEQAGVLLGKRGPGKEQVATTGRVRVKVDASERPIAIGDLLVTSGKPGMAMPSVPMQINGRTFHQPGTIVGKALEPLANGEGEILVLLSLQ